MVLRTKIIIGTIIGVLWVVLCIGLSLMPEPVEINYHYYAKIDARESYNLSLVKNSAKIIHTKIKDKAQITNQYKGALNIINGGGYITFTECENIEEAYGVQINVNPINLVGQKNVTAFKYVGDYVLLYLNDKYMCFSANGFEKYDECIGLYGKTFKDFKNPNVDIYINQNETNIKDILVDEIYSVCADGTCNSKYFSSKDEIVDVLYNNQTFVADKVGTYKINVKTNEKDIFVNVKVYNESNSPYKNILQIQSNTQTGLALEKTNRNNINAFLESSQLKIKLFTETEFVPVSKDMIKGLRTDRLGRQLFEIEYKNLTYCAEAIIYDKTFTAVEYIKTNEFLFITEEGDDSFWNDLTITEYHFDGSIVPNISLKDNNSDTDETNDVEIDGYDKDRCIKQIVTLTYKGHETKILVNVLSHDAFEEYNKQ